MQAGKLQCYEIPDMDSIAKWLSCPLSLRPRFAKAGIIHCLLSIIQTNQQHIEQAQEFSEEKMETNRHAYTDTRRAEKAGSWYEGDLDKLVPQLNGFFAKVPETVDDSSLPIPGARIIIAP